MRAIVRCGVLVGAVCGPLAWVLEPRWGLGAACAVLAAGIVAGLATAKWLEWSWYGRQLRAGAISGAVACGIATTAALLALLVSGPHSAPELAARSRIHSLSLAPLVRMFGPRWGLAAVIWPLVALALGVAIATGTAWLAGCNKSARAVRLVAQARAAAQASQRSGPLSHPLAPVGAGMASLAGGLWPSEDTGRVAPAGYASGQPVPLTSGNDHATTSDASAMLADMHVPMALLETNPRTSAHSGERTRGGTGARHGSEYLNSEAPAARDRDRQASRDWLC